MIPPLIILGRIPWPLAAGALLGSLGVLIMVLAA
jgi:hypothetical protein